MDSLKRKDADEKVLINLELQLLSIKVLPPQVNSMNIFIKIVRNDKVYHESKKYEVKPNIHSHSILKTKINF